MNWSVTLTLHRLLYHPQLVVDSNMKLVHLNMKHPEGDVSLSNGELFMVKPKPYVEHLAHGQQIQPICLELYPQNFPC